jgi:hypothetical protein
VTKDLTKAPFRTDRSVRISVLCERESPVSIGIIQPQKLLYFKSAHFERQYELETIEAHAAFWGQSVQATKAVLN